MVIGGQAVLLYGEPRLTRIYTNFIITVKTSPIIQNRKEEGAWT